MKKATYGRRVAQRLWVVIASDVEGEANAVEAGVNGVKGSTASRKTMSATGSPGRVPRENSVLDGKPRGGLRRGNEGNEVVGDVGNGEGANKWSASSGS